MTIIDVTTGKPFISSPNQDLRYIMRRIDKNCVCYTCIVDFCCSTNECNELNEQAEEWLEKNKIKESKK